MRDAAPRYYTLDAMRGIAALVVVCIHTITFFGGKGLEFGYLAVDLFFVISGFVIEATYAPRVAAGLSALAFMRHRIIRFYPLFLVGLLLGLLEALPHVPHGIPRGPDWDAVGMAKSLLSNLLMLPALGVTSIGPYQLLYPFDPPAWSLLFELLINLFYVLTLRRLGLRSTVLIMLVSLLVLALRGHQAGTVNGGYGWDDIWVGIPRVCFSFFAGVLLCRYRKPVRHFGRVPSGLVGALILLAVFAALARPALGYADWLVSLLEIVLVFPALVWLAVQVEPRQAGLVQVFSVLGAVSYAVYVIHWPCRSLLQDVVNHLAPGRNLMVSLAPWGGLVFLLGLVVFAWLLDRFYDPAMRRWLAARTVWMVAGK